MTDWYLCSCCFETKPLEEMVKNRCTKSKKKGDCKKCHALRQYNYYQRKKAEMTPKNYMTCDDCDSIFSKIRHKGGLHTPPKITTVCPKCKSKNIQAY